MTISFIPKPGAVLNCDFKGFIKPEMVKRRLVVTVSHRTRIGPGLVTIVPISQTPPTTPKDWHCLLSEESVPPTHRNGKDHWVKCDMISTVSVSRLDRLHEKRFGQERRYFQWAVAEHDLLQIQEAIGVCLGLVLPTPALDLEGDLPHIEDVPVNRD